MLDTPSDTPPIFYQLEWRTRRSRSLSPRAESLLRRQMTAMAKRRGWDLGLLHITGPLITAVVRVDPQTSPHQAQYWLKRSAVGALRRLKEFKGMPSVWTRKYKARTLPGIVTSGEQA